MIGERLKQARKAAGLTTRALAEQAGVSAMAISKYETGKSMPSSGVLLALAKALGVRVEYFFRPTKIRLEEVEYRKHAHVPKRLLAQIDADVVEQVERFVELETFLPKTPVAEFRIPHGLPSRISAYGEIEALALRVRQDWKLGQNPIPELTDTLEERGVRVFLAAALHNESFDGLAARVDGTPVIVVGKGWPGDRQRFTLAHELGHLILQNRLGPRLDPEKAANRFAGAFLVPEPEVKKELGPHRTWLEPQELCALKRTYGLSMQGWMHRARDLDILSEAHYLRMVRYFSAQGWRKREPCEAYPQEQPKLFEQLVFRALAEEAIGESKAAELLKKPLPEFRAYRALRDAAAPHQ
jgi:Zn-dependent peptidase ImmA (M78 family)/DNA-binding XRE family transcriptional regulator